MSARPADVLGQSHTLANGVTLKNRLLKSAMSEILGSSRNEPTRKLARLYGRWADGGLGLAVTGNVMVDRRALGEPGNVVVEDERDMAALQDWAAAGTRNGMHLWMQINHPGKQSPGFLCEGGQPVAPSAIAFESDLNRIFKAPRALTSAEVDDLVVRYGTTAGIAKQAGFTGVQIHGAHGYLVSQFLSPIANQRRDKWGGSLENRMRFVLEIYHSIRGRVGSDFPVAIKMNSADFQRGGFTEAESMQVMEALASAGIDLIEISGGTYESAAMMGAHARPSTREREAYFLKFAEEVRGRVKTTLAVTGGFRTDVGMAHAVASGAVDLVGIARALALNPDLPQQVLSGAGFESAVKPVRTGIAAVDKMGALELTYYENQMALLAAGREARPQMSAWESMVRTAATQGLQSFQQRRAR